MGRTGKNGFIPTLAIAACTLLALPAAVSHADPRQVYKWVDQNGGVHYGDAIPPQYADQDKTVLNAQGVAVGTIAGRQTAEQQAQDAARRSADDRSKQSQQRDQTLLATYLSVEEIESLRDRRAEILEGQARITDTLLEQLRGKQRDVEAQVRHFRPYNPNAGALPERIAEDLVRTTGEIATQEQNVLAKQQELTNMKAQFAADITRFRELKSGEAARAQSH
jgi:hypothetical protein